MKLTIPRQRPLAINPLSDRLIDLVRLTYLAHRPLKELSPKLVPMCSRFFLIVILGASVSFTHASEDENRLVHYLFSEQDYNPLVRPTRYLNETVVVSFGLLLVQLIHVKAKSYVNGLQHLFVIDRYTRRSKS